MKIQNLLGHELEIVVFDAETYYDQQLTLSKMTTTEYVRHPKFKVHGASILRTEHDSEAWWITGCDLQDVLNEIDWAKTAILCHNTAFDGLILSQVYGHIPAMYLDTMSMSRGEFGVSVPHSLNQLSARLKIGAKLDGVLEQTKGIYDLPYAMEKALIPYANQDVDLTWAAFKQLHADYPKKELQIIDITLRAFCDPVLRINRTLCEEEIEAEAAKKSSLVAQANVPSSHLMSNQKFAALLEARGVEVPKKISPRTNEETYAFSKQDLGFQALLADERVTDLVQARLAVKSTINSTRAKRLILQSNPSLPVLLNYCGAHTHRWSAGDKINLQNLPSGRNGQSNRLRRSIEAPDGYVICVVDAAQIECRTNAWGAGEEDLLTIFKEKGDPYAQLASKIYNKPINKADNKAERNLGKVAELGLGYGMGWKKFAYTVRAGLMGVQQNISDAEAEAIVRTYRRSRSNIVQLWEDLDTALSAMVAGTNSFELGPWVFLGHRILMPNGLFLHFPNLREQLDENTKYKITVYDVRNGGITGIYGAKLCENLIQSTARSIVAQQAIELAKRYRIVNLVHDEIVYLAKEDEADEALQFGIDCLRTPPKWCETIPLDAEGGYAKNYSK